jgi:plasmid stabilization system protein ParE
MLGRKYSLNYSGEAMEDLSEIAKHYYEINPALKEELRNAVVKAEEDLKRNPYAFSRINFKDFRRILLTTFPYKMIDTIEKYRIRVFAVLHHRRSNRHIRQRLKK